MIRRSIITHDPPDAPDVVSTADPPTSHLSNLMCGWLVPGTWIHSSRRMPRIWPQAFWRIRRANPTHQCFGCKNDWLRHHSTILIKQFLTGLCNLMLTLELSYTLHQERLGFPVLPFVTWFHLSQRASFPLVLNFAFILCLKEGWLD